MWPRLTWGGCCKARLSGSSLFTQMDTSPLFHDGLFPKGASFVFFLFFVFYRFGVFSKTRLPHLFCIRSYNSYAQAMFINVSGKCFKHACIFGVLVIIFTRVSLMVRFIWELRTHTSLVPRCGGIRPLWSGPFFQMFCSVYTYMHIFCICRMPGTTVQKQRTKIFRNLHKVVIRSVAWTKLLSLVL